MRRSLLFSGSTAGAVKKLYKYRSLELVLFDSCQCHCCDSIEICWVVATSGLWQFLSVMTQLGYLFFCVGDGKWVA
ncbi:hypothetical protein MKW98_031073 [Papaver atlanticum]|uniref:Uncharacterized protein n=1 Tax=Papaver atlanticum TaxID=357466 RepID=A0AAD4SWN9_9MAGN|nr:hypothetical protein MKW98_031073 [Papaver atlanticum]